MISGWDAVEASFLPVLETASHFGCFPAICINFFLALAWDIFLVVAPGLSDCHLLQASFSGFSAISVLFCLVSESSGSSANSPSRGRTSGQNQCKKAKELPERLRKEAGKIGCLLNDL